MSKSFHGSACHALHRSACPCPPHGPRRLGLTIDLAANEGWNPGLHDADAFWAADPGGFFAVETGDEVIGTFSVERYGDDFAFGGLYVIRPGWRGEGWALPSSAWPSR